MAELTLAIQRWMLSPGNTRYFIMLAKLTKKDIMRQLTVENFSCINSAAITFGRLTVIVGPQASGKSILCKLSYFFIDVLDDQWETLNAGEPFKNFEELIRSRFMKWFPVQAWGNKKFTITFCSGELKITIARKIYAGNVGDSIRIKCSPNIVEQYSHAANQISNLAKANRGAKESLEWTWQRDFEIRRLSRSANSSLMGTDFVENQIFVPAGRSFFTSVGKAVTAFDQSGLLDPLTVRFGRLFATYRDRGGMIFESPDKVQLALTEALEGILGGKFVNNKGAEYVETNDGRKVPLSSLSSGQQELLPLVSLMPLMLSSRNKKIAYIEEPEAHLFPSAQSKVIEVFAQMINETGKTDLVLTTHSPYVLVKINNLIKAGQVGRMHGDRAKKVSEIVARRAWLLSRHIRAYAIVDGTLQQIVGTDGFIDGAYLDDVSGQLEVEFNNLMAVQHEG